ncbi:MAG: glycosyltransferase [Planctomycetota bacterium]
MRPLLLTFTNLFPSAVMPTHGLFVRERMLRVAAALPDWEWQVVAPVPTVAWLMRRGVYQRWHEVPPAETLAGTTVHHPRYRHWPGLSLRRQADAMARGALPLVRRLAAGRPVVLDAHYLWPDGVAAAEIARGIGAPYVLTARGSDVNVVANDPVVARRIADAAAGAAACFAVSGALARRFAAVARLPAERVQVARNGVDLLRFEPGDGAVARAELGLPQQAQLLLGVGRLVVGKGFGLAAAALAQLPETVRLVLVGDGPERAAIAAAGGDRVTFLGTLPPDGVATACRACDLLVLPSEREGWPNVVTEALASGLRVVATRVGGIPEILGDPPPADGSLGALVPPGDVDALARALRFVLGVPSDPRRVRAYAERFGWREPVALLADAFSRALPAAEAR